jgi:hypothetical protein
MRTVFDLLAGHAYPRKADWALEGERSRRGQYS